MINGSATLTELELTKLENFGLKHAALQQAQQANLAARSQYIKQIEAAHPGYSFSEHTGQLVSNGPADEPLPQAEPVSVKSENR
jgi:hypothetical protein